MQDWPGLIEAYRSWLPVSASTPVVTLREGATPLIPVPSIAERIGKGVKVYVKYDGLNPTGSFKDRGMTMAISKAKEALRSRDLCQHRQHIRRGRRLCPPSRHAGLRADSRRLRRPGKAGPGLVYGAEVLAIRGNFDRALDIVREVSEKYPGHPGELGQSLPVAGAKDAAFEMIDALGEAPDWLCIPMGNAGNITAYWMGFQEYTRQDAAAPCRE